MMSVTVGKKAGAAVKKSSGTSVKAGGSSSSSGGLISSSSSSTKTVSGSYTKTTSYTGSTSNYQPTSSSKVSIGTAIDEAVGLARQTIGVFTIAVRDVVSYKAANAWNAIVTSAPVRFADKVAQAAVWGYSVVYNVARGNIR